MTRPTFFNTVNVGWALPTVEAGISYIWWVMPTLASCYIALVGVYFTQEYQERYPDKSDEGAGRCPNEKMTALFN